MRTPASDVLFVFPPAHGAGGAFRNHLGAAYVRAALAREGMTSTQFVCRKPGSIDATAAEIVRHRTPIVGFTAYDENVALCVALARSIKRRRPDVRIVFGGPAATFSGPSLMERHNVIDICVRGEAEETARNVFVCLLDGTMCDNAPPGIALRRDGQVVCTPMPTLIGADVANTQAALDVAASPYLSGILTDGRAGVLTGRGCTHHCQYCCFAALARNRLRLHSVDRVLAELEYIAAHRKRSGKHYMVAIHDDAFTLLPTRAKALCQAIADRQFKMPLSCITRADTVDDELLKLMREAGFLSLAFGLESAVPSVLRATGKVRPPDWHDPDLQPEKEFVERVRNSVMTAKKHGFYVGVSVILGLPTETAADAQATLRFVREVPVDYYMHNSLWIFPGTPLWETHERYGISCTVGELGLAVTTGHAYDVTSVRPVRKCAMERNAQLVRLIATGTLYGCEALAISGRGIRAAVMRGELSRSVADWLGKVLSIGSIAIQVCPAAGKTDRLGRVERDRGVLQDALVPVHQHIHLHAKKRNGNREVWQISCAGADLYGLHKPSSLSIIASHDSAPLQDWAKGQGNSASLCDVTQCVRGTRELASLLRRIESVQPALTLGQMPPAPSLTYSGRWRTGKAPCRWLSRIELDAEGNVRCCRHGEPIGKVGDSRHTLLRRLSKFAAEAEQRRGCAKCPSSDCPRCPFPGIDEQTYCALMRGNPRAQRLLDLVQLYARLPLLVALQQDTMAAG